MNCRVCESDRILQVSGKCSDRFGATYKNKDYDGYVTSEVGIGGGDYVEFKYCLECGTIQNKFPVQDPDFFEEEE